MADASKKRGFLVLNQHWLVGELRLRGHDVTSACFYNEIFDLNIEQAAIEIGDLLSYVPHPVDTIIFHDDSGLPRILGLESCPATKVFYSVDAHHHHQWHAPFAAMFDLVLVAQKNYIESFHYSPNKHWFPAWALFDMDPVSEKKIDTVFRGNMDPKLHPKRKKFFDELQTLVPVDAAFGDFFEDYSSAKIVINQAVSDDLNFRVFEAMACGAMLLTPSGTIGLPDIFTDGEHLVVYERDNAAAAADKIRFYLSHEDERARIARAGWDEVRAKHSNSARADTLLKLLDDTDKSPRAASELISDLSAKVYIFSFMAHRAANAEPSERLLDFAKNSLMQAFQSRGHLSDDELSGLIFMLTDLLREMKRDNDCLELLKAAYDANSHQLTYALLYIEQLLFVGKNSEAADLADKLSDKRDELLAAVPRLLSDVRKERATWLKKQD